jgi:hypothetical protein
MLGFNEPDKLDLTTKGEAINKINYIVKDENQKKILNDL